MTEVLHAVVSELSPTVSMTSIHTSFETCGRVRGSVSTPSDGLGV